MFSVKYIWDVGCSKCEMFRRSDVSYAGCLECGIFGTREVVM